MIVNVFNSVTSSRVTGNRNFGRKCETEFCSSFYYTTRTATCFVDSTKFRDVSTWVGDQIRIPRVAITFFFFLPLNTRNGERGTGNGEWGTGNGEPGTGVWERVYSGNPPDNSKWRTKEKKEGSVTVVKVSFYRLCTQVTVRSSYSKARWLVCSVSPSKI